MTFFPSSSSSSAVQRDSPPRELPSRVEGAEEPESATTGSGDTLLPGPPYVLRGDLRHYLNTPLEWTYSNPSFIMIPDRFPKSTLHYLVLPRVHPYTSLKYLGQLAASHVPFIESMQSFIEEAFDNDALERRPKGRSWKIGFHEFPSSKPLHCHIMTDDHVSPHFENKAHVLAHMTPLFLPLSTVLADLRVKGRVAARTEKRPAIRESCERWAIIPRLVKCKCGKILPHMEALKACLEEHYRQRQRQDEAVTPGRQERLSRRGNKVAPPSSGLYTNRRTITRW